ncbi:BatD family protein [Croceimicrobium sp.]|uniref:BatD family protein n=1 Tax=Croceimicrobium sp. TaxID=2828340 RepID=UPI003BAABAE0
MKSLLYLLLLVFGSGLMAQNVKTRLEFYDQGEGTERVRIIVSVDESPDSIGHLEMDGQILPISSTSSQMSIINGVTTREVSYTFYYYPDKKGDFNFYPPTMYFGEKHLKGKEVEFSISHFKERKKDEPDAKSILASPNKRISFSQEGGILEEYMNGKWTFIRKLDKQTCAKIILLTQEQKEL